MSVDEKDRRSFDAVDAAIAQLHRRQDTSALRSAVRRQFGSGHAMFMATHHLWERMGMRPIDAFYFENIKHVTRYSLRTSYGKHPKIGTLKEASPYLASNFFGLSVERFLMFCVNQRGNMKERFLLNEGIADTALFDLRTLLRETSHQRPLGGVIIAHNHPQGTLRPSQEDIDCTVEAIDALSSLGIPLLDHVIVAGSQVVSLRENGFIPESVWAAQHPNHRMLKNWLSGTDDPPVPTGKKKKTGGA